MKADLEFRAAENLPELPPKKLFFNKNLQFIRDRLKGLNKYVKSIILIYEAIENPILQRFLEIDTNFNPNYEYEPIDIVPRDGGINRQSIEGAAYQEVSSLFLVEGDKMTKAKKRFEERKEASAQGTLKKLTKQEEQERYLFQQFNVKDLPK